MWSSPTLTCPLRKVYYLPDFLLDLQNPTEREKSCSLNIQHDLVHEGIYIEHMYTEN